MAIAPNDLQNILQTHFPDAEIDLKQLADDHDHYQVHIKSAQFQGKSMIQQHQMVYKALGERMGGELHALSIKTEAV